jgi:biotin carboxylase
MKKTLLIIGAGREQIPAYQIAKKMGLTVIGTDRNPDAPAFDFADKKLICSTRDANHTLEIVLEFSKKNPINGVMTIANDASLTVALVANTLGLPGISSKSAKYASYKSLMKNQFIKFGIPTPKSEVVENKKDFLKLVSKKNFPLILKPSDGRGGRGVLYLDRSVDLNWAWDFVFEISDDKKLMLEEYVVGDQLSVEGIFIKKKYFPIGFADRNYENLAQTKPHIIEDGGTVPSKYDGEILDKISSLIEKASKSVKIDFGSVKADIVLSDSGPMIIELAARLSGNYFATHHIPMAYGVDIVSSVIKISLGDEINESTVLPKHKKYLSVRYFFPKQGKIKEIKGLYKVKSLDYVKMLEIFHTKGELQPKIEAHAHRAGTITCEGENYSNAISNAEKTVNEIKFIVE